MAAKLMRYFFSGFLGFLLVVCCSCRSMGQPQGQPQSDFGQQPQDFSQQDMPPGQMDQPQQDFAPQGNQPPGNSHGVDDSGPNFGPPSGGGGRGGSPGAGNPFSQPGSPGRETYQRQFDNSNGNGTTQGSAQEHLNQLLAQAVRSSGGQSANGYEDPRLCALAVPYAHKMAQQGKQDNHAGFKEQRAPQISKTVGPKVSEITAESYPGNGDARSQIKQCVDGWLASKPKPGTNHSYYQTVMKPNQHYCYAAAYSRTTKRFFCVGITVE